MFKYSLDERFVLGVKTCQAPVFQLARTRGVHLETKHGVQFDRQMCRFVTPIFKNFALRSCFRDRIAIVVAEPRKQRQFLAAHEHVDRVNLNNTKFFNERNRVGSC